MATGLAIKLKYTRDNRKHKLRAKLDYVKHRSVEEGTLAVGLHTFPMNKPKHEVMLDIAEVTQLINYLTKARARLQKRELIKLITGD